MIRKISGFLTGFLGSAMIFAGSVFAAVALLDSRENHWEDNSVLFFTLAMAALIIMGIVLSQLGQRIWESGEGQYEKLPGLNRWGKRGLFFCGLSFFSVLIVYSLRLAEIRPADSRGTLARMVFFSAAVLAGTVLFLRNEVKDYQLRKTIAARRSRNLTGGKNRAEGMVFGRGEEGIRLQMRGSLRQNDEVFLYYPDRTAVRDRIAALFVSGKEKKKARDCMVQIRLEKTDSVPDYTAVSNVKQVNDPDSREAENPYLCSLISVFGDYMEDREYVSCLLAAIREAVYLIPVYPAAEGEAGKEEIIYPQVASAMLEGQKVLPVFTDWDALARYRTLCRNPAMRAELRTFEECVRFTDDHYDAVVINPFGRSSFFLSPQFLVQIRRLDEAAKEAEDSRK